MPQSDEPSHVEQLNEILYKIIVNEIFGYEENLIDFYPLNAFETLEKKGLIRKIYITENKENYKFQVIPWLKTRIFEEVVAKEGLERYLDDLIKSESEKPDNEVKLNSLISSSHLSFSINKFIFDVLKKMNKGRRYISDSNMSPIEEILSPNDKFIIKDSSIKFDSDLIEDLRLNMQKYIYNNINPNEKRESRKSVILNNIFLTAPKDFVAVYSLEFEYNKLLESIRLLASEEDLKVILLKRYIVLIKEDKPICYITNRKIGYSPSRNRLFNVKDEDSKKDIIFIKQRIYDFVELGNKISNTTINKEENSDGENLKKEPKFTRKSISDYEMANINHNLPCFLCGNLGTIVAFHEAKGFVIVCDKCSNEPVIKAILEAKLIPK